MKDRFCFWSIAWGKSKRHAQVLVDSARSVGLFKEFHIWTDGPIEGATCHPLAKKQWKLALGPLHLLPELARRLRYDYFIWLDPQTFVTRPPGDPLRVLQGAPVHASFEQDASKPVKLHPDWGPCSLTNFTTLMRFNGVRSRSIFTVNNAFWIVHHDAVERFCQLSSDFWWFCRRTGYTFGFAPLLAYATQILCGNPYIHRLKENADLWAPVRTRSHVGQVPSDGAWNYCNYFSGETIKVKPALVHPMRPGRAFPA